MSNNGMNYPMYNTLSYPQIVQQQRFPHPLSQPQYGGYQMYSSMQTQPQYNNYNQLMQSAAETLAAFTAPTIPNTQQSRKSQTNHNRRPTNNPPGSANSTRTYYCETCRIACGGQTSYHAHINGTKHKKKEANTQPQQTNQNTFRCELCDVICTGTDAYKSHLDGSKHDKALKLHRKLGKTIPQIPPTIESQAVVPKATAKPIENNAKSVGLEYIETRYDSTNTPISYYCKICECTFNDSNSKDAHLKGRRHRISYKKKVNPTSQAHNDQSATSKRNSNEKMENTTKQTDTDGDIKYLMNLHEQIIPTKDLLDIVEQFVSAVEAALKSCSDQFRASQPADVSETIPAQHPLMGVSRVGPLVKNLMIKSDRLFHIVVICSEWPTMNLFEKISLTLSDKFTDPWKKQINIQSDKDKEIIQISTNTTEGQMIISISLTSLSVEQADVVHPAEQLLTKTNCSNALNAMHSVRWFQQQLMKRKHASALIRCLRYKTKISQNWQSLSSEAIEILIEHSLAKSVSVICAFRRVLEYLSGGLVLSNGLGLRIPWQTDSINDVFDNLNNQERYDITHEAQMGLRLMAFGQLNKWLEQYDIPLVMKSFQKRSYPDPEDQNSNKRQCTEVANTEGQIKIENC